jgi:TRAP-type C4-dicarboxylate transport system permease large subunit|tara:strand:+ start:341 stop:508 length:168 start_codon:yes stop_codon:yes gene_type:complete
LGGIYGGLFTATEAAAISAFTVIVIGSLQKGLLGRTLFYPLRTLVHKLLQSSLLL